jgi:rare lipoprotein A
MKRIIALMVSGLVCTLFCTAQNQQTTENGIYRQEGIASWYGSEYDGRYTASGEIFDSTKFTASHPTLPFGTILTVTNLQNNKQVIVRINDRGPLKPVRIIDVTRAAAEQLDMIATGTAPVLVEIRDSAAIASGPVPQNNPLLEQTQGGTSVPGNTLAQGDPTAVPGTAVRPGATPSNLPASGPRYRIQVGAFKVVQNAVNVINTLKGIGLNPSYEKIGDWYRVVLPGITADDYQSTVEKLQSAGFRDVIRREEQ